LQICPFSEQLAIQFAAIVYSLGSWPHSLQPLFILRTVDQSVCSYYPFSARLASQLAAIVYSQGSWPPSLQPLSILRADGQFVAIVYSQSSWPPGLRLLSVLRAVGLPVYNHCPTSARFHLHTVHPECSNPPISQLVSSLAAVSQAPAHMSVEPHLMESSCKEKCGKQAVKSQCLPSGLSKSTVKAKHVFTLETKHTVPCVKGSWLP
jgi:hypothetical protein